MALCKYHRIERCAFKDTENSHSAETCTYQDNMQNCPWFAQKKRGK